MKGSPTYIVILDGKSPGDWEYKGVRLEKIKEDISNILNNVEKSYPKYKRYINFSIDIILESKHELIDCRQDDLDRVVGSVIRAEHTSFDNEEARLIRDNYSRLCEIIRAEDVENGPVAAHKYGYSAVLVYDDRIPKMSEKWFEWVSKKTYGSFSDFASSINIDQKVNLENGNHEILFKSTILQMAFERRARR